MVSVGSEWTKALPQSYLKHLVKQKCCFDFCLVFDLTDFGSALKRVQGELSLVFAQSSLVIRDYRKITQKNCHQKMFIGSVPKLADLATYQQKVQAYHLEQAMAGTQAL